MALSDFITSQVNKIPGLISRLFHLTLISMKSPVVTFFLSTSQGIYSSIPEWLDNTYYNLVSRSFHSIRYYCIFASQIHFCNTNKNTGIYWVCVNLLVVTSYCSKRPTALNNLNRCSQNTTFCSEQQFSGNTIILLNSPVPQACPQTNLLFNLPRVLFFLLKEKQFSEKKEIESALVSSGNSSVPNQSQLCIRVARNGATQLLSEENLKTKKVGWIHQAQFLKKYLLLMLKRKLEGTFIITRNPAEFEKKHSTFSKYAEDMIPGTGSLVENQYKASKYNQAFDTWIIVGWQTVLGHNPWRLHS